MLVDSVFVTATNGHVRIQMGMYVVMLDPDTAMEMSQRLKVMVNQARRQRRGQKRA